MSENKKAKINFDAIIDKLVGSDLSGVSVNLSESEKKFLRENPQLLKKINSTSFIKKRYIFFLIALSLFFMVISKIIEHTQILQNHPIWDDLLGNVAFSITSEIFGAALMAYILELLLEQRMKKNQQLAEELEKQE
ncbi:hypothetical protein [Capnocytophaga catalasegens]|uniref:Uncharacterized protein n=1 Tax=Capnocytophaga catalasegens TaxID=1004260 RepID=A0AAV5AZH3_9FLAO|nr:hypothetical protein [Capnocytophaga catalasegens]GIZ16523.1 hypothetical protein RCZ03_25230 [Capnocytophaga catalasegens]GJM51451.1 hypothetical protein RCZ15_24240 [Capnocytophaga catalasegens]GJM53189.1 hypothetical protein RCZ16_15060 [Capnocytophaga catalasegens]